MAVMDEFKEERESINSAPFAKKVEYFWDYYKWHTIISVAVLIMAVSFLVSFLTSKDSVLFVTMINGYATESGIDDVESQYMDFIGANVNKEEVSINTSVYLNYETEDTNHMYGIQAVVTYLSGGELDAIACDEVSYINLAYLGTFVDLEEVLTEEEMKKYEEQIFYIDQVMLDEIEASDDTEYLNYVYGTDPSVMEEPIAVGIYADEESMLIETFYGEGSTAIIGVVSNSCRMENAVSYLKMILE